MRRIAAYGVCRDGDGRVLVVRAAPHADAPGSWALPGGAVAQGEHPADTVVREYAEETGLDVAVCGVRDVRSDVERAVTGDVEVHTDRVVYDVEVRGGQLRDEVAGGTGHAGWRHPAELSGVPMLGYAAEVLGVAATPRTSAAVAPPGDLTGAAVALALAGPAAQPPGAVASETASGERPRMQRFSAYGLVTDPRGRVLLTRIAAGYPSAGRWHAPGGGTDFGEQPAQALLREIVEETGQYGRVTGLLDVSHRHNPSARGPEGYPIDWHTVRVLYRVEVEEPTVAKVTEAAGGSTAEAAWFDRRRVRDLVLTDVAATLVRGSSGRGR